MEEKKDGRVCEDNVITKNPMFYLQQGIKAFLKCLGFESPNLVDTNKKEQECVLFQEDGNKQGSDSSNDNYKYDPPVQAVYEDPPQSQKLVIEAATRRRGRPPQRPPVGSGSPPQNN